jgi:hypothetical protein
MKTIKFNGTTWEVLEVLNDRWLKLRHPDGWLLHWMDATDYRMHR